LKSASTTPSRELPTVLPEQPVNGVTAGIDWASEDHAVSVVDDRGRQLARQTVEHTAVGLRALMKFLAKHDVAEAANQLKNRRSRYGSAGNKDDRFDAFVLADTLRTDRARLRR